MRVLGVAAIIAAGVVAGALLVQWLGLPQAGPGDIAAARASVWLDRYRETSGELEIGGRRVHSTCVRGWIDLPSGSDRRGTLLRLSNGATIRDFPPHTLIMRGVPIRRPVALLQAAGCPRVLADRLAELAQFDGGVRAVGVHVDGASAIAVRFPRLTLFVDRRTDRPIGVTNPWLQGMFHLIPLLHTRESP